MSITAYVIAHEEMNTVSHNREYNFEMEHHIFFAQANAACLSQLLDSTLHYTKI